MVMNARLWLLGWLGLVAQLPSCDRSPPTPGSTASSPGSVARAPALPLERIAIVGASISAGFGGTPFGDAFTQAAGRSKVDAAADAMLFRDPVGNTTKQLAQ